MLFTIFSSLDVPRLGRGGGAMLLQGVICDEWVASS